MNLVCSTHTRELASARCVRCGHHLCDRCRMLVGVRNYCADCAPEAIGNRKRRPVAAAAPRPKRPVVPPPPAPAAAAAAAAPPTYGREQTCTPRKKSPFFSAALSLLPGLGQLWNGRIARGALFGGSAVGLNTLEFIPLMVMAFLYVFNMWDAWRLAECRNDQLANASKKSRIDDTVISLVGIGTIAWSIVQQGGLASLSPVQIALFGALALGVLAAQDSREQA